jgi:hypothetical protein
MHCAVPNRKALYHEDVWGSGHKAPRFLELRISGRRMVSFMLLQIYPRYT